MIVKIFNIFHGITADNFTNLQKSKVYFPKRGFEELSLVFHLFWIDRDPSKCALNAFFQPF